LGKGEAIKQIIADFEKAGYITDLHLVNMADYGVPETRQRVIIIGQRKDLGETMIFHFPEPTHDKNAIDGRRPWKSIREAIDHFPDPDEPNDVMNHEYSKYKVEYRDYTAHRRTDPDKPSPIRIEGNKKTSHHATDCNR
jgi:DNA (cytosine-5)-methyltransferase 1